MSAPWLLLAAALAAAACSLVPPPAAAPARVASPASGAGARAGRPLLLALAGVAAAALLVLLAAVVATVPHRTWSAARLAPTAALVHGFAPYAPAGAGAVLSSLYGPASVLYFLPAFLLEGLTPRLLAAGVLNVLALLVPFLVLLRGRPGERDPLAWLLAATAALAVLLASPPLVQMVGGIHVDALAVGLGLGSCHVLSRASRRPGAARLGGAALLVVLAAWSKQIEAPLVLAQLVWLALVAGGRSAGRYLAWLAGWGLATGALFLALFEPRALAFNLLTIPAGHPLSHLRLALRDLLVHGTPFLLLAGLGLACAWRTRPAAGDPPGAPGARRGAGLREALALDGALLALAGLVLLPVSVLARAKLGAYVNSLHFLPYLLAAGLVGLRHAAAAGPWPPASARPGAAAAARLACAALLATLLLGLSTAPWAELRRGLAAMRAPRANPQEEAFAFARAHPGRVWFPWNPLAALEAEGELHHFEWALVDRELAGHPLEERHLRAHLPRALELIAFPPDQPRNALRYLPEFTREVRVPGLAGWVVYAR